MRGARERLQLAGELARLAPRHLAPDQARLVVHERAARQLRGAAQPLQAERDLLRERGPAGVLDRVQRHGGHRVLVDGVHRVALDHDRPCASRSATTTGRPGPSRRRSGARSARRRRALRGPRSPSSRRTAPAWGTRGPRSRRRARAGRGRPARAGTASTQGPATPSSRRAMRSRRSRWGASASSASAARAQATSTREALALVGTHRGQPVPARAPVGDADRVRGPQRERHVPQVVDRRQLRQQALRDLPRRVARHHLRGRGLVLFREPDERDGRVAAARAFGHDAALRRAPQAEHEALLLRPVHAREAREGECAQAVEERGARLGGGGRKGNGRRRGHACSWNLLGGITQDRGTWPLPPSVMRVANRILRSTQSDMWRT